MKAEKLVDKFGLDWAIKAISAPHEDYFYFYWCKECGCNGQSEDMINKCCFEYWSCSFHDSSNPSSDMFSELKNIVSRAKTQRV